MLPCVVSGEKYGPLLMDRSALLQVLRHPARDRVDAHPVQCVWLSDVWVAFVCTALHTWVMLRSVEAVGSGPPLRGASSEAPGPVRR